MRRQPESIIGRDAMIQLVFEGYVVVPAGTDAPELLAAIKTLMSELPNYMAKSKAVIDAKAAIAKAEGR